MKSVSDVLKGMRNHWFTERRWAALSSKVGCGQWPGASGSHLFLRTLDQLDPYMGQLDPRGSVVPSFQVASPGYRPSLAVSGL